MKNALILLAGGTGRRLVSAKNTEPKQFIKIGNYNLIEYFLRNLDQKIFNRIHIVVNKSMQKQYLSTLKKDFSKHQIILNCNSFPLLNQHKNSSKQVVKK